jgi:D-alanyl-D-alanine carboxypeptidase
MDAETHAYIRGHNTQQCREVASLTKMYTLYACL